ncbi:MAG: hypothetical protein JWL59_3095 [Chthoniobacteraceae bacterium]|nr:hypothetical protein [Chthoniobacteraceae bacterium]
MKRTIFVTISILSLVCGVAVWLHSRSIEAPSLSFVSYRGSPAGTVAVFRATNSSSRPFAFWGYTPSEPLYWYRIPSGSSWQDAARVGWIAGRSCQTLPSHSSIEFTVLVPSAQNSLPINPLHVQDDSAPPPSAAFAVVVAFIPGDGPSVQADSAADRNSLPYNTRIALAIIPLRQAFLAGLLPRRTYGRLHRSLMPSEAIWVTSDPAPR